MWAEDYPEQGHLHAPEFTFFLLSTLLGIGLLSTMPARSYLLGAILASTLLAAPCIVAYYSREEFGERKRPLLTYVLYALPALFSAFWFIAGLWNPSVVPMDARGVELLTLRDDLEAWPTTTLAESTWLRLTAGLALYLLTLTGMISVDNEWTLARVLRWLLVAATALACFGWVQEILRLVGDPIGSIWFLRFFQEPAFASVSILWFGVSTVFTASQISSGGWMLFFKRAGLWKLTGWLALGMAAVYSGGPYHAWIVSGFAAGLPLVVALWRMRQHSGGLPVLLGHLPLAIGFGALCWLMTHLRPAYLVNRLAGPMADLRWDLWERLALERLWWGWGGGSFEKLVLFFQPVDLQLGDVGPPSSSLLQLVLEQGLPGVLLWALVVLVPLIGFLRLSVRTWHSWGLLIVGLVGLFLAVVSDAGAQVAFAFSLWLIFFIGLRWSQILSFRAETRAKTRTSTVVFGMGAPQLQQAVPQRPNHPSARDAPK